MSLGAPSFLIFFLGWAVATGAASHVSSWDWMFSNRGRLELEVCSVVGTGLNWEVLMSTEYNEVYAVPLRVYGLLLYSREVYSLAFYRIFIQA